MFADDPVQFRLRIDIPGEVAPQRRGRGCRRVHLGAQGQDVEQRIEQPVAHLLQHIDRTRVPHERRAGMPPDRRPGETGRYEHRLRPMPAARFRQVHLLVDRPHQDQRAVLADHRANRVVVGLLARNPRHRKGAGQPQIALQEILQPARIGLVRHHPETGRRKEILRHRPPQIPQGFQRRMLFAGDERLRIQPQQLPQLFQKRRRRRHPQGRLQIRLAQTLGQPPAKLAVHHHVDVGVHQMPHFGQVRAQGHHHVDLGPDALDQTADLVQVRRHVEHAVHRPQDVDARLVLRQTLGLGRHPALGHPELGKDPGHRPVGTLPLIFINGARQEPLDVGARRRHPAADHLGNAAGDHHRRQCGVQRLPRPRHRRLGARAHLAFAKPRHHDRQLMRRQRVGVMQHRGDRQVLATHRAVDHHLQALDRAERIDRAPIPPRPVVILDQQLSPPADCIRICMGCA